VLLRLLTSDGRPNVKIAATEDGSALVLGGQSDPTFIQALARGAKTSLKLKNKRTAARYQALAFDEESHHSECPDATAPVDGQAPRAGYLDQRRQVAGFPVRLVQEDLVANRCTRRMGWCGLD
jgi:hypothetical protein